ncbi:hypothetical protein OG562_23955 [Streptomyces sp. NBC_01275]|nr:hypothetical protein [Streptomyces sp. NBC_01275]MCX4763959.1 hypothetical protein [Streptomyces sp. NBC_01275]
MTGPRVLGMGHDQPGTVVTDEIPSGAPALLFGSGGDLAYAGQVVRRP